MSSSSSSSSRECASWPHKFYGSPIQAICKPATIHFERCSRSDHSPTTLGLRRVVDPYRLHLHISSPTNPLPILDIPSLYSQIAHSIHITENLCQVLLRWSDTLFGENDRMMIPLINEKKHYVQQEYGSANQKSVLYIGCFITLICIWTFFVTIMVQES